MYPLPSIQKRPALVIVLGLVVFTFRGFSFVNWSWSEDTTDTLDVALAASGCDQAHVRHKPGLLSDNGPSYIAGERADYIEAQRMSHVWSAPMHPQTQGKIERWHET